MNGGKKGKTFITILFVIMILYLIGSISSCTGCGGSSHHYSVGEQRCWNCGKVIINSEGRMIHCSSNGKCEYCGTLNRIK